MWENLWECLWESLWECLWECQWALLKYSPREVARTAQEADVVQYAYGIKAIMHLEMFDVEWTGHEEANCEDASIARIVLCLLGDF